MEPRTDFLWSREIYEELVGCGVLGPEDRIERLNGRLMTMSPRNTSHAICCNLIRKYLDQVYVEGHDVCPQLSLALDPQSEPEPDSFGEKRRPGSDDALAPNSCEESAIKVAELLP